MLAEKYEIEVPIRKKKAKKATEKIELFVGQTVRYGFYSNITFEGFDESGLAILKDKSGNIKKVSRSLFQKYVEV